MLIFNTCSKDLEDFLASISGYEPVLINDHSFFKKADRRALARVWKGYAKFIIVYDNEYWCEAEAFIGQCALLMGPEKPMYLLPVKEKAND